MQCIHVCLSLTAQGLNYSIHSADSIIVYINLTVNSVGDSDTNTIYCYMAMHFCFYSYRIPRCSSGRIIDVMILNTN